MASSEQLPIYRAAAIANVQLTYKLKFDLQWSNRQCRYIICIKEDETNRVTNLNEADLSWPAEAAEGKLGESLHSAKLTAENARRWIQLKV